MRDGNILILFADSEKDLEAVSGGKKFIANNGTDYGVPLVSSIVMITSPDKEKKTFILNDAGEWEESGSASQAWTATVIGLGLENPNDVKFIKSDNFPTKWEEVSVDEDVFIKFPKVYRKVNLVEKDQIVSFTISNMKLDDEYKPYPCFIDESGNELDYILVGKYMSKSEDVCNSVAAGEPILQLVGNGREKARAKGTGYQLMDWRIQRLWQDLIICAMETVNTNNGEGIETDRLGIYWGDLSDKAPQFIDGIMCAGRHWNYSNFPSQYVDQPIYPNSYYNEVTLADVPRYMSSTIIFLGYDSSTEFFNYPMDIPKKVSSTEVYYCDICDSLGFEDEGAPILSNVGSKNAECGAFNEFFWACEEPALVRLCYRPIEIK